MLFADLSASTRLCGGLPPEVSDGVLGLLHKVLVQAVERHGGRVHQVDGDGLLAVFGWQQSSERDAVRAVEAALDMRQAIRDLQPAVPSATAPALPVRWGIHGGMAALPEAGALAAQGAVGGQFPAFARHLSALALDDEILVTEESLGPFVYAYSTHRANVSGLEDIGLAPRVRKVLGRLGPRSRYEAARTRGTARFAGRATELQTLRQALEAVQAGPAGFLALSAPPGAGKTRLAEEFLRLARSLGCQVLRGESDAGLGSAPLQPFADMLRRRWPVEPGSTADAIRRLLGQMVAGVDPASEAHVPALLALLGLAAAPAAAPAGRSAGREVRAALVALLDALARKAPLVVFIDDWQWADDASRETAFDLLARPGLRVLVLVATRSALGGDVSLATLRTLAVAPLSDEETRQAAMDLLPGGDPFVVQDIVRWSGGNPLHVEELCHHVVNHRGLPRLPAEGGPGWLEALTASRLAALPAPMRQVLDAAAVIGVAQSQGALMHLAGCSPDDPRLSELARHDFLYPAEDGDGFRFKHELTRRVVHAALGPDARRQLHRRMAEWLCADGEATAEQQHCEALAYHWAGAGEHALAARCGELAGDRAMANSSVDRAKIHYRAVLDMLEHLPDTPQRYQVWRSITRRYGLASVFDPGAAELQVFQRAVAQAQRHGDQAGAAFAEYWSAYGHYALGRNRQALAHGRSCMALAKVAGEGNLTLQVRAMLAQVHAASGDTSQAEVLFAQTVPLISQLHASGAPVGPGLAYLLACQGGMLGDFGRFDEAERCFALALDVVPGAGHEVNGSVHCLRACVRLWAGLHDDALADAEEAERVGARVRSLYICAMGRALAGRARWCRDASPSAAKSIADATAWLQAHGQQLFISLNHGWLAEAAAAAGDVARVRQHAALALGRARALDLLGLPMALRALTTAEAPGCSAARITRRLDLADRIARRRGSPHEVLANDALRRALLVRP